MTDLDRAKAYLSQGYTCAACLDNHSYESRERGVGPLLAWLDDGADLMGYSAADKAVGAGAAMLYCLLGVRRVHGRIMSIGAVKILRAQGIETSWDILAEHILNRSKTGLCPIEAALAGTEDPEEGLRIIRCTLERLSQTPGRR